MHDTAFNYELSSHLDELVLVSITITIIITITITHLDELVLIQSAEEKLGLDALLQPRPLLVCLGVHHLHMMMMMMLMMMMMVMMMRIMMMMLVCLGVHHLHILPLVVLGVVRLENVKFTS